MIRALLVLVILGVVCRAEDAAIVPSGDPLQHRVALVDVGYIFKKYKKFDAQAASLREAVEQADQAARMQVEQMQALQRQLDSGAAAPGNPERARLEQQLIKMQTGLAASRQVEQRDLLKKEAEIYKTAYLEVQDAVRIRARERGYTLVLQFSRPNFSEAGTARDILEQINNSVIFYSGRDDISDPVLQSLNEAWSQRQSGPSPAAGVTPQSNDGVEGP